MADSKEVKTAENDAKSLIVRAEDDAKAVAEKIEAFFEHLINHTSADKHAALLALHTQVHEAAGTADVSTGAPAPGTTSPGTAAQETAGQTGSD